MRGSNLKEWNVNQETLVFFAVHIGSNLKEWNVNFHTAPRAF